MVRKPAVRCASKGDLSDHVQEKKRGVENDGGGKEDGQGVEKLSVETWSGEERDKPCMIRCRPTYRSPSVAPAGPVIPTPLRLVQLEDRSQPERERVMII